MIHLCLVGSIVRFESKSRTFRLVTGLTYVVSAGNNGEAPPPYSDACATSPASTPNAITIGASDLYDSRWRLSNYGRCVDLFAPGSRVLSASYLGDTESIRYDGTSMAAPHVIGAVALYLSTNPTPAVRHRHQPRSTGRRLIRPNWELDYRPPVRSTK